MGGGPAPAHVVIVHGWQVVVDQGEGMHQFDGHRRGVEPVGLDAERLAGGVDQQGAQPLAAAEDRVAHGLVQALRRPRGGWKRALQRVFRPLKVGGYAVGE